MLHANCQVTKITPEAVTKGHRKYFSLLFWKTSLNSVLLINNSVYLEQVYSENIFNYVYISHAKYVGNYFLLVDQELLNSCYSIENK